MKKHTVTQCKKLGCGFGLHVGQTYYIVSPMKVSTKRKVKNVKDRTPCVA